MKCRRASVQCKGASVQCRGLSDFIVYFLQSEHKPTSATGNRRPLLYTGLIDLISSTHSTLIVYTLHSTVIVCTLHSTLIV